MILRFSPFIHEVDKRSNKVIKFKLLIQFVCKHSCCFASDFLRYFGRKFYFPVYCFETTIAHKWTWFGQLLLAMSMLQTFQHISYKKFSFCSHRIFWAFSLIFPFDRYFSGSYIFAAFITLFTRISLEIERNFLSIAFTTAGARDVCVCLKSGQSTNSSRQACHKGHVIANKHTCERFLVWKTRKQNCAEEKWGKQKKVRPPIIVRVERIEF